MALVIFWKEEFCTNYGTMGYASGGNGHTFFPSFGIHLFSVSIPRDNLYAYSFACSFTHHGCFTLLPRLFLLSSNDTRSFCFLFCFASRPVGSRHSRGSRQPYDDLYIHTYVHRYKQSHLATRTRKAHPFQNRIAQSVPASRPLRPFLSPAPDRVPTVQAGFCVTIRCGAAWTRGRLRNGGLYLSRYILVGGRVLGGSTWRCKASSLPSHEEKRYLV